MPLGQDLAPDFTKLARNALTLKSFNHKLNKLINARLKSVSGNHCLETRYRGRYRVACQAMDLISVDLFEGAGVLAAVKDKALARGPAALLDLRCARRPAQCQIGTAE